jgi:cell division septal protein FtsQ
MYEQTYHKTVLKTDAKNTREKKPVNWKSVMRLLIGATVIAGIIVLIRLPRLQVKTVNVVGANVADPGDISEFVQEQLQGNKLFIFPKTSIFLVSARSLEKNIKKQFPRFQMVSVTRANFSTLTVSVTEFQGIYLWCTDESTCYFMDQNGTAFAPAPYFSGNAYLKIFAGQPQALPFQAVSSAQLNEITLLIGRLSSIAINPEEFHFINDHELDVDFSHNGHQAQLLFDPTMNVNSALETLYTGLRTDPLMTKFHDASQVLQYIDLRFANRVVYKFQ